MSPYFLLLFLLQTSECSDLNVGTTLFTKADSCKACWSSENLALLTSRMILEDLLPSTSILVIDSNDFVTDLVEYFRLILEIVRQETHGKAKHITLLALTDLLGGYLHHAVLPIAKYSFYGGLIDYDSMATLLGLFDELKWFLRTNGQGWAKPLVQIDNFEIQRIPLQDPMDKDLCANLIFAEGDKVVDEEDKESRQCDVTVPLPFFDSVTQPSAIALPTKTCPLHNVASNTSSYIVMKFFVTSYKCLKMKNAKNLDKFQDKFCAWIEDQIMPRLQDEKFYAAFGGILRVRSTLQRLGVQDNNVEKQIDDFRNVAIQPCDDTTPGDGAEMTRTSMILTAVLITIFVWFLLGTMFICYKMRQSRQNKDKKESEEAGKSRSSSLVSSKCFFPERLKPKKSSKGRRKRGQCSCSDEEEEEMEEEETMSVNNSVAQIESSHTEGRLPSITEISEHSSSTPAKRHKNESFGGSTTAGSSRGHGKVQKQVYLDTDTETEETSEPV